MELSIFCAVQQEGVADRRSHVSHNFPAAFLEKPRNARIVDQRDESTSQTPIPPTWKNHDIRTMSDRLHASAMRTCEYSKLCFLLLAARTFCRAETRTDCLQGLCPPPGFTTDLQSEDCEFEFNRQHSRPAIVVWALILQHREDLQDS